MNVKRNNNMIKPNSDGIYVFRNEQDFSVYWLGSLDVYLQNGWEIIN